MNLQPLIPSIGAFMAVVCAGTGALLFVRGQIDRRVRGRLQDVIVLPEGKEDAKTVILRDINMSSVPFLNNLLKHARWAQKLDTLLVQGDLPIRLGAFVFLMLFLGTLGMYATVSFFHQPLLSLPVGALMASIPVIYARHQKQKRIREFEKQFPDALDMLTNALRAGLALSGAIQVVADESPDPVGKEFSILFEEHRLGVNLADALKKLMYRIDSAELHLFVTAVILQRETGGNLAEILEGTAHVIRERFRILGDVRTLTAQARLSGFVLMLLPLALTVIISVVAPEYLKGLLADPLGKSLVVGAIILQVVGILVMRRIVDIKV